MKTKIKLFIFIYSLIVILFLCIYTIEVKPVCELEHLDEIDRSASCISDENMAKELADIVLEIKKSSQSIKEIEYDSQTVFDEKSYEWVIKYILYDSQETKIVRIRKDNGMITVYDF